MDIEYRKIDIQQVAKQLIEKSTSNVLCFYALMGAGKTTLIKALVKELGAIDMGSSPTFGIVNEYHDQNGELLAYHFDFYRLNDETEAFDLGLEEYLSDDVWVFIEWPEKINSFLPKDANDVHIKIIDTETRIITLAN